MTLLLHETPADHPCDVFVTLKKPSSERRVRQVIFRRSSLLNPGCKDNGSVHTAATAPMEYSDRTIDRSLSSKKRVTFGRISVADTLNRDAYTKEELEASFFTDEDYEQITKDCCKQVSKMEQGKVLRDKKYSSRGLEGHTLLGSIAKFENRMLSISLVLSEQERQRTGSEQRNHDLIAVRYHQCTSSVQLWAHTIGMRDQREAAYSEES